MTPAQHLVLARSCPDRPGIVHAAIGVLARRGGTVTESPPFGDAGTGLFFVRDLVATGRDLERRVLARAVRGHAAHRVFVDGGRTVGFRG